MEAVVGATLEQCLTALWDYFRHEWPYPGEVYRTENSVTFVESHGPLPMLLRNTTSVRVSVEPEGEERTRLYMIAERRKHAQTLEKWIREELPGRAASIEPSTGPRPPTASNIPDQIKRLAELRDSGAITDEEFERKKAELLDRM
jgi:hypothetical protein